MSRCTDLMLRASTIAVVFFLLTAIAAAQVPATMSFQGELGSAIRANSQQSLIFRIYTVATGGSSIWRETQTVTLSGRVFSVILGSNTPLTLAFDEQYWIGVAVGSGNEMVPRVQLTSAPYSLNAQYADTARIATGPAGGDLTGSYPNPTIASTAGSHIITAINNSSATINASRIGNGLTDTQLNDNLTINGGAIDNTPIGNTTRSTGKFTSLDASIGVTVSGSGGELRLQGTGTGYTALKADGQGSTNVTYTLPLAAPTSTGQVLSSTAGGVMSWASSLPPDGAAGGDLAGNYPNPTIASTAGNDIIIAVNNGSTTINAARVGNGLTDTQLNDDLTINGGTIDNTPIGNTTRSDGNFTSIDASTGVTVSGSGSELRLQGTGTGYSALKSGAQGSTNITYTLPASAPVSNGQVLSSTTGGTMAWTSPGGLQNFTESVNTAAPNATVPVVQLLANNAATNVDVALTPKGTGALTAQVADNTTSGGNKRGTNAVDLQTSRDAATQIASGTNATIVGGSRNTASGDYSIAMGNGTGAIGGASTAMGFGTVASGPISTAMGSGDSATGFVSTAMGNNTVASGDYTIAMGNAARASGAASTAMGDYTTASGTASTAIGQSTTASGIASTAMGNTTRAIGGASTAMGFGTTASGIYSTAMGNGDSATGFVSMAMGNNTVASNDYTIAVGNSTRASGTASTAMGDHTTASGSYSTAMGNGTGAIGSASTAMGFGTVASGPISTAMGSGDSATGYISMAIGNNTVASGDYTMTMGNATKASGTASTAMGDHTTASGIASIAIGQSTTASGTSSTAMGNTTRAIGGASTAMGFGTTASGIYSTAMGNGDSATGYVSMAMGNNTVASNDYTIAMGNSTRASGTASTAMGDHTTASGSYSTAMGNGTGAIGGASTAIGFSTVASGAISTAMGSGDSATGYASTAMGNNTVASGDYTMAMGNATRASGAASTAMGDHTTASGTASTATGSFTIASGISSTATGDHTTASGNSSTAMGTRASTNDLRGSFVYGDSSSATVMSATAIDQFSVRAAGGYRFFSDSSTSEMNGMYLTGGNVGIGVAAPNAKLNVNDGNVLLSNSGSAGELRLQGTGSGYNALKSGAQGTTNITYTLPTTVPASDGQVLSSTTGGVMSWTSSMMSGGAAGGDLSGSYPNPTIASTAGNSIVTAVNNGSGTINATRIGVGLTDAQVNDNLTISGGAIDNTPIGNTTRGSGRFTSLDANSGVTLSGSGSELRLQGTDAGYSALKSGAQGSTNITYTLPTAAPTSSGQVLSSTTGGAMTWVTSAAGLTNFTESVNTSTPNATVPVVQLLVNNAATNVDAALTPKGTGALTAQVADNTYSGGNKRGEGAVDWQRNRNDASQVASGTYATIVGGRYNKASGEGSTAMGFFTSAEGFGSTSMGYGTRALGDFSTAMGNGATASGMSATAMGEGSFAGGNYSTAMGGASAQGSYATAMGSSAVANGSYSVAMGHYVTDGAASGNFLFGDNSTTTYLNAGGANQFAVRAAGGYRFFSDASMTAANGMFFNNGNLGVGISSPGAKLDVSGNIRASGSLAIGGGATITNVLTATATLDFSSTSANSSSDLTITVTGAVAGDVVFLGAPNGSVISNTNYTAWVSASNTVTVRFNNYGGGAGADPSSGTFRVTVMKF